MLVSTRDILALVSTRTDSTWDQLVQDNICELILLLRVFINIHASFCNNSGVFEIIAVLRTSVSLFYLFSSITDDPAGITKFNAGINVFNAGITVFNAAINIFNAGITIFNAGITIFNAGINVFNAGITVFNSRISLYNARITLFSALVTV